MKKATGKFSVTMPWLRARQKPVVRGASARQQVKKTTFNWKGVRIAGWVLVLVSIVAGLGALMQHLLNVPVSRVAVNGEFRQVAKQTISDRMQPFLEAGYLQLDLEGMREQLREIPWVFDVEISRHWPNEIVISVEEQTPIARWGKQGYLNFRGELFVPEGISKSFPAMTRLPMLDGPVGLSKEVMNHYRELNSMLQKHGLTLTRLRLDERGSWSAQLDNGIDMYLGDGEVMEKMRRFLSAYRLALASDFERASSVDMRYSSGFAVSWRE